MNGFLALGNNEQIYHSLDAVTWTPAHYLLNGMQLVVIADNGNGNLVIGPIGGFATNKLLTSHDDGVSWAVTFTSPIAPGTILNSSFSGGLHFYLNASNDTAEQAGNALWDGGQFVLVGINTSFPFVDMFSTDGDTWQVWAQTLDSVPGPATFYVPQDLLFFGGVYVGIVSLNHPSLIWSPTAGKNAGPVSPAPQTDWTVGLAVPGGIVDGCFFKTNGAYILAFGLVDNISGDFISAKSTDGKNWTQSLLLNGLFANNGKDSVWWDATLNLWFLCGADNGGEGLWSSVDGLVWTPRIYDPTFALTLNSVRRTGWFLSAVGNAGAFYISTDGVTWVTINDACPTIADPWDLSFIHSIGNYFVAHGFQVNSPFQEALITSPNGTVWTARQNINSPDTIYNVLGPGNGAGTLTSYLNPCTDQPVFPPTPPPPPSIGNNLVLLRYMGSTAGFSLLTALPDPPSTEIITLKEVQAPAGGSGAWAKAGDGNATMMALTDDAKSWILFNGTQDGSIIATAITQPLPTPSDLPPELWNSNKIFRAIWFEGEDLGGFRVFLATDRQLNPDGTFSSFPFGPFEIINNKVNCGGIGVAKRIGIKLVHAFASAPGVTPLITYINIDYDIMSEAN